MPDDALTEPVASIPPGGLRPVPASMLLIEAEAALETVLAHPDYSVRIAQQLLERALTSVRAVRLAQRIGS